MEWNQLSQTLSDPEFRRLAEADLVAVVNRAQQAESTLEWYKARYQELSQELANARAKLAEDEDEVPDPPKLKPKTALTRQPYKMMECVHCGQNDVSTSHWEKCSTHPANVVINELKADEAKLTASLSDANSRCSQADVEITELRAKFEEYQNTLLNLMAYSGVCGVLDYKLLSDTLDKAKALLAMPKIRERQGELFQESEADRKARGGA